jgi:hypothetical protein
MVFWIPFYSAIHYGQVTPILTGLLALGIGQTPFKRGFICGLTAALKPTYVLLLPFISLSFGRHAFLGSLAGVSLSAIHPPLLLDYLRMFPSLAERGFDAPGLMTLAGPYGSAVLTSAGCLWLAWRWRGKEDSYLLIIGMVTFGMATWWHAFTPLVLPAAYYLSRRTRQSPEINIV